MARAGERATPPIPAPAPLARLLKFRSLPATALDAARRVLDNDDEFRARVAAEVDEARVGRAGMLVLTRPDGWEDELADLVAAANEPVGEPLVDRRLQRRLDRAQQATERAVRRAEELADRIETLESRNRHLVEQLRSARNRAEELAARADELEADRGRAVRELKAAEERSTARAAEVRTLRAERDALVAGGVPGGPTGVSADADRRAAVAAGLAELRNQLVAALDGTDRLIDAAAEPAPAPAPEVEPAALDLTTTREHQRPPTNEPRQPLTVPPGLLDTSVAAAEALVAHPGVVLVIDGYNVTKLAWPDESPARQRERLEHALDALNARTGARAEIVYDGEGSGGRPVRWRRSTGVHVRFTAERIEADDVVVALADHLADEAPVVVVSSDGRVRAGAAGARIRSLASEQLLAVLGCR